MHLFFASLDIHIDEWLYELNIVTSSNIIYVQYSSYNALRHIAQKANIRSTAQPLEACKGIVVVFLTSVTSFLLKEKQILLIVHVSLPIIIHLNICLVTEYFANFRGCQVAQVYSKWRVSTSLTV